MAVSKWGKALPSVSAPMRTPSASPRRSRNQPAASFMPGGYTHASEMPVRKRRPMTASPEGAHSTAALVAAPASAPRNNRTRAFSTSDRLAIALASVPATKPAWTAIVSHAARAADSANSSTSTGVTAVAENHSVMPKNSATASAASIFHAVTIGSSQFVCTYRTSSARSTTAST